LTYFLLVAPVLRCYPMYVAIVSFEFYFIGLYYVLHQRTGGTS